MARTCRLCGFVAEGEDVALLFRITRGAKYRRGVCDVCRQQDGDAKKRSNRWLAKARSTLGRHATKFIKRGKADDVDDFRTRYGWDEKRIAHEMEHAYGNGCTDCGDAYLDMGHGLGDITIDIIDPGRGPYYGTNTRFCCGTCNKEKGDLPPDRWDRKKELWRVVEKWQAEHPRIPRPEQLTLSLA